MSNSQAPKKKTVSRIFLFLLAVSLLSACGGEQQSQEQIVRPVRSMLINSDTSINLRTFSGVSRSAQESSLSFKVSGTIESIPVKVGQKIKAGTVIASLDSSTYQLQLQQAQATVAQSSAASRNARAAYDRTRGLYANNNASLGELDSARANSESASAQLNVGRKSLELSELNVAYTNLTIDVDCTVDSIAAELNENVSTTTEIARVNCSNDIEIEVAVPESIISEFDNGKRAMVSFDAITEKIFEATVIEVGVGASGVGSTFPVTVLLSGTDEELRTGLAASVSFNTNSSATKSFVVPLSAVAKRTDGIYVYVIDAMSDSPGVGLVKRRAIELGELQTAGVEVLSGLQTGERVVTAGVTFMREDLKVSF